MTKIKIGKWFRFLVLVMAISACNSEKHNYRFLFVGHTYDWTDWKGSTVDSRLENVDLSQFDGFWLGGDICANTSLNPNTFRYLNKLFDLGNPNSHFVLGNHDYRDNNLDFYFHATGRPDYYTSSFKNLVVSVVNTNLNSSDCENLDAQYEMLLNVTDTISEASHYVIMMHHQIFKDIKGIEKFKSNGICPYYSMNCDRADSYFETKIYPRLAKLEQQGLEVLIIVGDTGWDKGSEKESVDGVTFLASGINNSYYLGKYVKPSSIRPDKVLIFELNTVDRKLSYEFVSLNELSDTDFDDWFINFEKD